MIRKLFTYGLGESIARGINWLILALLPLYAASPEDYGMVGVIVALESLGSHILMLGQDRSVLRFYYHEKNRKVFLYTIYTLCFSAIVLFVPVVLGASFFSDSLAGIPVYPHLILLVGIVLFLNLNKIYLSVLRVEGISKDYMLLRVSFASAKFVFVLLIVQLADGSLAYVAGLCLAAMGVFIATLPQIRKRIAFVFDPAAAKRLWAFGWPFMFHVVGSNILMFADRFMLEYYLDLSVVGSYTLAYTLGSAVVFIYGALSIYFEPIIYRKIKQRGATESLIGYYGSVCTLFGGIWGAGLVWALPLLLNSFWGLEYASILDVTPIVLAAHLIMPIYLQANYRLTAYQKTKTLAQGTVIAAFSNVLLNIVLIPAYGVEGAAMATYFSFLILSGMLFFASLNRTGTEWRNIKGLPVLAASIAGTGLLVVLQNNRVSTAVFAVLALLSLGIVVIYSYRFSIHLKDT